AVARNRQIDVAEDLFRAVEGGDLAELQMRLAVRHSRRLPGESRRRVLVVNFGWRRRHRFYHRLRPRSQTRRTIAKLLMKRMSAMSTAAHPNFILSGIREIWLEMMLRCIDMAMNGSPTL